MTGGDTHPDAARRLRAMIMRQTGEERLKIGCSMFDTARRLALASLQAEDPRLTPFELRQALFLRFYRSDFDPKTAGIILEFLKKRTGESGGVIFVIFRCKKGIGLLSVFDLLKIFQLARIISILAYRKDGVNQ